MNQPPMSAATPPAIVNKLRLVRRRKLRVHATSAVVAAIAVLLAAMSVSMLVDWLAALYDSGWRLVLTSAAIGAAALAAVAWLALARHSLRWQRVAEDVDRQLPQSQERWATVAHVERTAPSRTRVHPAMFRRVATEALKLDSSVQPENVVALSPLLRMLLALAGVVLVLAVAIVVDPRQTFVLMRRFWSPNSLVSATEIVLSTGDAVVGRGESFDVIATIEGTLVDKATLTLQSDAGREETIPLVARGEPPVRFAYGVEAIEEPLKYRLRAGDGQTPWHRIDVASRPELGDVLIRVTPPEYTGEVPSAYPELSRQISALAGSRLEIALRPKAPVKSCHLRLDDDRSANLLRDDEGWYRWTSILESGFTLNAIFTEAHGLTNDRPLSCRFVVVPDAPPAVEVLTPDDEIAVQPDDTIEITFSASDDVGVGAAELIVYDNESRDGETPPIATIPIPLADQVGDAEIRQTVELDLSQFELQNGHELSYEIRVHDTRGTAPNSGAGNVQDSENLANAAPCQDEERADAPAADSLSVSSSSAAASEPQSENTATPSPADAMSRRSLDVPQSSSSRRMRITVDRWAGSFSGQQRIKLELAIAPELEALDRTLADAQQTAHGVLEELQAGTAWRHAHAAETSSALQSIDRAKQIIAKLERLTIDTPYAFVGLQVTDIGLAHVEPARSKLWLALQSSDEDRPAALGDALQHLGRARDLLLELQGQYERTSREFQLAEAVERVKKMYQVFVEDSQTLLKTRDDDPSRYNRALAEFDLDDDYLKRLQEVLEMRRDLRAELARILAQDPRLLRRFMDALQNRSQNLREELADLHSAQTDLNREVKALVAAEEDDRARIENLMLLRHVSAASDLQEQAGDLQSLYQTWLPLDRQGEDADLVAATNTIQEMATSGEALESAAAAFASTAQSPKAPPGLTSGAPDAPAPSDALDSSIASLLQNAQGFYDTLLKLEAALRQLAVSNSSPETAGFAANRLLNARLLVSDVSAWIRQLQAYQDGQPAAALELSQYRLAAATEQLAAKLGGIEQSLAALLQLPRGGLPKPISDKAREFLAILDNQTLPNQLAALYSLRLSQLPRAMDRQQAAELALGKAEDVYDDLMRLAIEQLDKLPVQDPISDLLDDPTLDELLAMLEQEPPLDELLGIPARPSNLRIVDDWMQSGGGGTTMGSGMQMLMNQLQQDQQRARQQLDRSYRRAIARALKEATPRRANQSAGAAVLSDWNTLASRLSDDLQQGRDKAPPEEYRRAIVHYFDHISRTIAESDSREPRNDAP